MNKQPLTQRMPDPDSLPSALPPACGEAVESFVLEHTGIRIQPHQRSAFQQTVLAASQRCGCASPDAYLELLRSGNGGEALEFLIAAITVGESYFFRDPVQISYLRNTWIPETCNRKRRAGDLNLRIWSAGCSNGQELYTLAMLLNDVLPDAADWRLHLLGTDINVDVLARCQRGLYSEWSFRTTPVTVRDRYFTKQGAEYRIDHALQKITRFSYLNLVADSFPSVLSDTQSMDLILCRNVFIYFEQDVVRKVVAKFRDCLVPDGLLMLAAADPVVWDMPGLEYRNEADTMFYRRRSPAATPAKPTPPTSPRQAPPRRRRVTSNITTDTTDNSDLLASLKRGDWTRAEQSADNHLQIKPQDAEAFRIRATARANQGKLEAAAADCEAALAIDNTDKHTHFLYGLILIELNALERAGQSLRKVLFLDHEFLEAHYQLGQLLLREGKTRQGVKSLRNALVLAENGDPQRVLHGSVDMSYERLAEILRQEISLHEES